MSIRPIKMSARLRVELEMLAGRIRMSLSELPPGRGDMKAEPSFSCSFFCEMAEREWKKP